MKALFNNLVKIEKREKEKESELLCKRSTIFHFGLLLFIDVIWHFLKINQYPKKFPFSGDSNKKRMRQIGWVIKKLFKKQRRLEKVDHPVKYIVILIIGKVY